MCSRSRAWSCPKCRLARGSGSAAGNNYEWELHHSRSKAFSRAYASFMSIKTSTETSGRHRQIAEERHKVTCLVSANEWALCAWTVARYVRAGLHARKPRRPFSARLRLVSGGIRLLREGSWVRPDDSARRRCRPPLSPPACALPRGPVSRSTARTTMSALTGPA
jgi:hypothetical protein